MTITIRYIFCGFLQMFNVWIKIFLSWPPGQVRTPTQWAHSYAYECAPFCTNVPTLILVFLFVLIVFFISEYTQRPYPTADKKKKSKGRQPGKSRIYTDTPEKYRLEDLHNAKQLKKIEQERKAEARKMKRILKMAAI